jgi:hypothetical protein
MNPQRKKKLKKEPLASKPRRRFNLVKPLLKPVLQPVLKPVVKKEPPRAADGIPRHLVPEDLQRVIIETNPGRLLMFTYSQRLNTQLMLDHFLLKKKKGPMVSSSGERVIAWRCTDPACSYTVTSREGRLEGEAHHSHPARPELYAKAHTRFQIKQELALGRGEAGLTVSQAVSHSPPEVRELLEGCEDAMMQAARRYKRKLKARDEAGKRTEGEDITINVSV